LILEYKNNQGYIYAYITWNIIDENYKLVDNGEIVAIGGTWVHPRFRNLGVLKHMISDLFHHKTTQKSLYVLLGREKYPDRPEKLVPIIKYFKYIKGVEHVSRKNYKSNLTNSRAD